METKKRVKDHVIPPERVPAHALLGDPQEAIAQLNVAFETGHHTVLVFDEAYKLVGMLLQQDILRGIEPKFAKHYEEGVPILWDALLESGTEERLARPIKDFMSGAKVTLDAEDSILKASHIMLTENAYLLPVMEGDKLIGVVGMGDLFQSISTAVLKV